jgi:hypothetical protein
VRKKRVFLVVTQSGKRYVILIIIAIVATIIINTILLAYFTSRPVDKNSTPPNDDEVLPINITDDIRLVAK